MRFEIGIDLAKRIARIRVIGTLDVSEFSSIITEFTDHPDFVPGMPAIWDMREADLRQITETDLRSVGEQSRQLAGRRGNARVALVVQDDFRFGMARMTQVLAASPNLDMAVFREFGAAEEWVSGWPRSDGGEDAV